MRTHDSRSLWSYSSRMTWSLGRRRQAARVGRGRRDPRSACRWSRGRRARSAPVCWFGSTRNGVIWTESSAEGLLDGLPDVGRDGAREQPRGTARPRRLCSAASGVLQRAQLGVLRRPRVAEQQRQDVDLGQRRVRRQVASRSSAIVPVARSVTW
ncbi:MAG: hypothetical protein MZV64_13500 [Ignavibacteriales bacterium]|nr:hypothetical protein [Ignavibacteriales bacterium]